MNGPEHPAGRGLWLGSDYMHEVFDPGRIIADARTHLETNHVRFDTLVGTGLSGALIVPILADTFDVDYLVIRTPGASAHARSRAEGFLGRAWVFVDDHLDTGHTLRRVLRVTTSLARAHRHTTTFVGGYFYHRTLHHTAPFQSALTLRRHNPNPRARPRPSPRTRRSQDPTP